VISQAVEFLSRHGGAAVFAGTFLEGETVLLAASALAQRGLFSPLSVWACASAGAWCGHLMGFAAGRWLGGHRLISRSAPLSARATQVDRIVREHPRTAIFLLQYLYGLRLVGAVALGVTSLPWSRFALYEAVNCLVWAALFTTIGSVMGRAAATLLGGWLRWAWLGLSVLIVAQVLHRLSLRAAGRLVSQEPGAGAPTGPERAPSRGSGAGAGPVPPGSERSRGKGTDSTEGRPRPDCG
jgi:membrane-associated protein